MGLLVCCLVQVHGRVSDIWRSYIVQRLLWDVGYSVAFSPPLVVQNRGPHNYLADMQVGWWTGRLLRVRSAGLAIAAAAAAAAAKGWHQRTPQLGASVLVCN